MQRQVEGALPEYRVFETDEFLRNLEKLSARDRNYIQGKLAEHAYPRLRAQPYYGTNIRKLRGYTPDTWRYRAGRYRVFYMVDEEDRTVYVLTVEARKDAYR
jgi:mRNA interferase RelE/StbE